MSRFVFDLCAPADDTSLCELLAATPMDGGVSIAMTRQPSYFAASAVDGAVVQVGVARDRDSGRIIGMGSRSLCTRYVNGEPVTVGYLSGLRLCQEYRGQAGLLARGYRFLRRLHADQRAQYYLTTIAADNRTALGLLTSERAGLPIYHPCGTFHTLAASAVHPAFKKKQLQRDGVEIRSANTSDRDAILKFLHAQGSARQFFPAYQASDLFSGDGLLKGLQPVDVLLAYRHGELVGTFGHWDQRAFKQIVIHGYHGWVRPMRPLYNAWAAWRRRPMLPAAGSVLPASLGAIPVVRDDDPQVFRQLLEATLDRLADRGQHLLLGLHDADPLLPIARQYSGREYPTHLYIVFWPDDGPDIDQLAQRIPYLELGCL